MARVHESRRQGREATKQTSRPDPPKLFGFRTGRVSELLAPEERETEKRSRGSRHMWRRAATAALSLGAGAGAVSIATSEDPAATFKVCAHLPPRLLRDSVTAATIAFDYKWSLWGLEPGTPVWQSAKHHAHLRSANRLQELCFRNGGIYIKLGQHIAQLVRNLPLLGCF